MVVSEWASSSGKSVPFSLSLQGAWIGDPFTLRSTLRAPGSW